MGFDWLFSNWELYLGLAVALAIALFIYLKQEIESMSRRKAAPKAGKRDNPNKNISTKEQSGGGTVTPAGARKAEKNPKDRGKKD